LPDKDINFRPANSPRSVTLHGRPQLHAVRAINMSDTFQSDRSARLRLAYQRGAKLRRGMREEQKDKLSHSDTDGTEVDFFLPAGENARLRRCAVEVYPGVQEVAVKAANTNHGCRLESGSGEIRGILMNDFIKPLNIVPQLR
jgi:hypothetical protein